MKKNFLNRYLSQIETETFSNFDTVFSNQPAERQFMADGGVAAPAMAACIEQVQASDPYIITITNTNTSARKKAILFGAYTYLDPAEIAKNANGYGSDVGISITVGSGSSYWALLMQTAVNPLMIYSWRYETTTAAQFSNTLYVNYTNMGNGKSARVPVPMNVRRNLFYNQDYTSEFVYPVGIDGNTYFELYLNASETVTITMFPQTVADMKQALTGRQVAKTYEVPIQSVLPTISSGSVIGNQSMGISLNSGQMIRG
jgi:hypothetical protein